MNKRGINILLPYILSIWGLTASAQNFNPDLYYRLVAKHNGKVLQVDNKGMDNQANVNVRDWTGGANQQWKIESLGNGTFRFTAKHSGRALDVNIGQDNQANVVQHVWHGGDNQRWKPESLGNGYYKMVALHSGRALDVNIDAAMNVVQHDWNGGDNQWWKIEPVQGNMSSGFSPGSFYRLTARHNGKVLQVMNSGMDNQADVNVGNWTGGANQLWKMEVLDDGTYRITAKHSGRSLDVNMGQDNQANVVQHDWHGGDNQHWRPEPLGDGYYRMIAKHSGRALDVNMDDYGNVVQHDWHGGANQQWKIEPVTGTDGNSGNVSGTINLTGFWNDDSGGKYRIRQMGNQVWWVNEKLPEVINVFRGTISGSILSGQWTDLPGGQLQNTGTLELKIVSGNRLEKVNSSAHYGGGIWSR